MTNQHPQCGEECPHGRFCTRDRGHPGEHAVMEIWHGRMQLSCTWDAVARVVNTPVGGRTQRVTTPEGDET